MVCDLFGQDFGEVGFELVVLDAQQVLLLSPRGSRQDPTGAAPLLVPDEGVRQLGADHDELAPGSRGLSVRRGPCFCTPLMPVRMDALTPCLDLPLQHELRLRPLLRQLAVAAVRRRRVLVQGARPVLLQRRQLLLRRVLRADGPQPTATKALWLNGLRADIRRSSRWSR